MSCKEFKEMDASEFPIGNLITLIARGHSHYLNHRLEHLNINASQMHSLFEIKHNAEINQDEIAKRCNIDKGSVARSLKKLEDKGLVIKKIDENNRRQNNISLTSKGEKVVEESIEILNEWENEIFNEIDKEKKKLLKELLKDSLLKTIEVNMNLKNRNK